MDDFLDRSDELSVREPLSLSGTGSPFPKGDFACLVADSKLSGSKVNGFIGRADLLLLASCCLPLRAALTIGIAIQPPKLTYTKIQHLQ